MTQMIETDNYRDNPIYWLIFFLTSYKTVVKNIFQQCSKHSLFFYSL